MANEPNASDIASAVALAADALQWTTLTRLVSKGILTKDEARQIIDDAGLQVAQAPPGSPGRAMAHHLLDAKMRGLDAL